MKNIFSFFFSREETDEKVANNRLLSHAAALAGQNSTYSFITSRLFVFLNTVLQIPAEKTGIITGVSSLWDAINDPLIGSLIDNRKYKPGNKLRPFLLYTPIFIGITTVLMFTDFGFTPSQTIWFVLLMYIIFDSFYSFQDIAIWGMASLSSPSSTERARVTQWISIGAGAGSTIASLFPSIREILVSNNITTEKNAYFLGSVVFGLGGMIVAMLAYRMKEKVEYQPPEKVSIIESILNLRHNRTLLLVSLARIVQSFSLTLPWEYFFDSEGITYNVFGKDISGGNAQVLYGFVMGIPGAITLFFTVKAIKKFGGSRNLLVAAEAMHLVARVICYFIGANNRFLNIGSLLAIMGILGFSQIFTNMKAIAERTLLTNSVEEIELKTGKRTEGLTFSMQNFVSKLTNAIPKFIQGYFLKFLGFDETKAIAKQTSVRFIKYRWGQFILGPAIGSLLYLIVIYFVKEDLQKTAEIERQLKEKREAAKMEAIAD